MSSSELEVIEGLKTYINAAKEILEKKEMNLAMSQVEKPNEGEDYYVYSNVTMSVMIFKWEGESACYKRLSTGNCFWAGAHRNPAEAAQMYGLRLDSMGQGFLPKSGEDRYRWEFFKKAAIGPLNTVKRRDPMIIYFKTREEAKAWGVKYGHAWMYYLNENEKEVLI